MSLPLLLFLTLACLPEEWPEPVLGSLSIPRVALVTWTASLLVAGLAALISRRLCLGLKGEFAGRETALHRYARRRFLHNPVLMAVFGICLYALGWGWAVRSLAGFVPGAEVLLIAPFLLALTLSWTFFYDADRAIHEAAGDDMRTFWGRGAYVLFQARQNLALVLVPLFLLVLLKSIQRLVPEQDESLSFIVSLGSLALAFSAFVAMPWILRLILSLKPLPEGPLRDRLSQTARRLNFRYSNILVWNTRNGVANAMVAGIVPWIRYVMLTDRLLVELTPEEVEAVFGHEIGHVRHGHMAYYVAFLMLSLALLWGVWTWTADYLPFLGGLDSALQFLPLLASLGAYIFVVFGFLSRRCERQADLFGCRAVSCSSPDCTGREAFLHGHDPTVYPARPGVRGVCPTGIHTFVNALEKVARLNGISRDRPGWLQSWQHSTIARRVEFLQAVLEDPTRAPRFQRRVAIIKWGLMLGLAASLGLLLVNERNRTEERTSSPPGTSALHRSVRSGG